MNSYQQFLQQVNELSARLSAYYAAHLVCRAGCSGCCHHHLSVFTVEADALQKAIRALPMAEQQRVVQQALAVIEQEARGSAVACPLLIDERCSVYEARPVICRTQGLPLLFQAEDGASEVDFCPLNFTAPDAINDLTEDKLVPLENINLELALLNLQHCRAGGIPDAQSGLRLTMSDVILQAAGSMTAEAVRPMAEAAVTDILAAWERGDDPPRAAVNLLCQLAVATDEAVQKIGIRALFPQVIESLNDSFSPSACVFYDRLFVQVIEFCRQLPTAIGLHELLNRFGLHNETDLLARKAHLKPARQLNADSSVQKIILLSRVTIGADVAINSVLLAGLRLRFPAAEFVLLGSPKLGELFGGDERLRVRALRYERGGGLLARLDAWRAVVEAVAEESRFDAQGDNPGEILVIDADSRLTQLGLLPVRADDHNYFYFESRSFSPLQAKPLAQLAAQWAHDIFGAEREAVPQLLLPSSYLALGQQVRRHLCAETDWLVTISWGVGGNARKRLDEPFEITLMLALLNGLSLPDAGVLPPCKLIIDKGGDAAERAQVDRLLAHLRAQGKSVLELDERALTSAKPANWPPDVIAWDGSIGTLAGLIAASDAYVGYDSAGQHLAAALGIATVTLFVNGNAPLFAERWRPLGKGPLAMIHVNAEQWEKGQLDRAELLRQVYASLINFY